LFHEEEKEEVVVGVVVGIEYLVSLEDVGMQVFLFFQDQELVGMKYFVYLADVGMQVFLCFQDDEEVGIEEEGEGEEEEEKEEEGNHLRKEPVLYCVNYKESVL
jgi:hypothetical protein